jgi:hypothetical protein
MVPGMPVAIPAYFFYYLPESGETDCRFSVMTYGKANDKFVCNPFLNLNNLYANLSHRVRHPGNYCSCFLQKTFA